MNNYIIEIIMIKFHILYILLLLVFYSCTEDIPKSNLTTIKLNPNKENLIYLSNIIDSLYIIPLEISEQSLLRDIGKLEYDDGLYFIENTQDNLVYIFNDKGLFICQPAKKGHGPGEIQYPQCFTLDKIKKEMYLTNNNAFNRYDYRGRYLGSRPYSLAFSDFCIEKSGNIFFYTNKTNNSHIGDGFLTGNITMLSPEGGKKTWFKSQAALRTKPNESIMSFSTSLPFSLQSNGTITCHYVFSDTIYSITKNRIDPVYFVDFGSQKPKIDLDQISGYDAEEYIKTHSGTVWYLKDVVETDDHLSFRYLFDFLAEGHVFYNKQNHHIIEGVLVNDLLKGRINMLGHKKNRFIGSISAYDIVIDNKLSSFISQEQLAELKKITPESNPILIEFTLKDF